MRLPTVLIALSFLTGVLCQTEGEVESPEDNAAPDVLTNVRPVSSFFVLLEVHDHANIADSDVERFRNELSVAVVNLYNQRNYEVSFAVSANPPVHAMQGSTGTVREVTGILNVSYEARNNEDLHEILESAVVAGKLGQFVLNPIIRMALKPSTDGRQCPNPVDEFACETSEQPECYNLKRLCDGATNCLNAVDESACRKSSPLIRAVAIPAKSTHNIGDNVTLHCVVARSYSDVRFHWILPSIKSADSVTIRKSSRDSTLRTTILSASDAGTYRCKATNQRGSTSAAVTIHVDGQHASVAHHSQASRAARNSSEVVVKINEVIIREQNRYASLNDVLTITCEVSNKQASTRLELVVPSSSSRSMDSSDSAVTLTIDSFAESDLGTYVCRLVSDERTVASRRFVLRQHGRRETKNSDRRANRPVLTRAGSPSVSAAPAPEPCADNLLQCRNGQCIDPAWRCDGRADCDDESDEAPCALLIRANYNQFTCNKSGLIIPRNWICDGDPDCSDQSDEENCSESTASCVYQCDGKCISRGRICDYETQVIMLERGCVAKVDELECSLPQVKFTSPSGLVNVPFEQKLELVCNVSGYPPPTISWSKDNYYLPSRLRVSDRTEYRFNLQERRSSYSVGYLTINPAKKEDNGLYRCEGSNSRGSTISEPIRVVVEPCSNQCSGGKFNSVSRKEAECVDCFCSQRTSKCTSSQYGSQWELLTIGRNMAIFESQRGWNGNSYFYPRRVRNAGPPGYPQALVRFPQPLRSANAAQMVQIRDDTLWINETDLLSNFALLKVADLPTLFPDPLLSYGAVVQYEFFVGMPSSVGSTVEPTIVNELQLSLPTNHFLVNNELYIDEREPRRTYRFGDLTLSYNNPSIPPLDFYINQTLRANTWNRVSFKLWEREPLQAYHEMVESPDHFIDNSHSIWHSYDRLSSLRLNRTLRNDYMMEISLLQSLFVRAKYNPNQFAFGFRNLRVLKPDTSVTTDVCQREVLAWHIENCTCPEGYRGLSCEQCEPGYNRVYNPNTRLMECTKCSCNNHSATCDLESGQCFNCWHNTDGKQCEQCAVGFYRNKNVPITSADACLACECGYLNKNGEDKFVIPCDLPANQNQPVCRRCPPNTEGNQCNKCVSGYQVEAGTCFNAKDKCSKYSRSVDASCCACLNNTTGMKCEYCKPGHFGYELMKIEPRLFTECTKCFCFNRSVSCADNKEELYWQKFSWTAPFQCLQDTHYRHWRYMMLNTNHSWNDRIDWRELPASSVLTSYGNKNYVDLVVAEQAEERMVAPNNWTKFLSGKLAPAYCIVPRCWLGDLITSYGGNLTTRVFYQAQRPMKSPFKRFPDVVITGAIGLQLAYYSRSRVPSNSLYSVRLHEAYWSVVDSKGQRRATRVEFLQVLAQVQDIYIKCLHAVNSYTNAPLASGLVSYELEYASAATGDRRALTVEQCYCPVGYAGTSCEKCADGYYAKNPQAGDVCRVCNCSGRADRCTADGECINCTGNSGGNNCERCADGYWGNPNSEIGCQPCKCFGAYGYPLRCTTNADGLNYTCNCPPGATGPRCEECTQGYGREDPLDLDAPCNKPGAQRCGCSRDGTLAGQRWTCKIPACTGGVPQCACKPLAIGYKCDRCLNESYINLDYSNELGCDTCYCSGRSKVCNASSLMRNYGLSELLPRYSDIKPTADCDNAPANARCDPKAQFALVAFAQDGSIIPGGSVRTVRNGEVVGDVNSTVLRAYWQLPKELLAPGVAMYSLSISFSLEFSKLPSADANPPPALPDVLIKSGGRQMIYTHKNPPKLSGTRYEYTVVVDEKNFDKFDVVDPQWYTMTDEQLANVNRVSQTRVDVLQVLSYVSGIFIRASYVPNEASTSTIRNLRVQQVEYSENARLPQGSKAVEVCPCPKGYQGLSCEKCAAGYRFTPNVREQYPRTCVPCNCHNHTTECNPETGECVDCLHNTEGYSCEVCQPGYIRQVDDPFQLCQPCRCPGTPEEGKHFAAAGCSTNPKDQTRYTCACDIGYAGSYCERCAEGYHGKPEEGVPCVKINVTIDYNYIFAAITSTHSLTCTVSPPQAVMSRTMSWTRARSSMTNSKTVINSASNATWTQVTFNNIDPTLSGVYSCCAYQGSWSECQSSQVNVSAPPKLSATLSINVTDCAVEQQDVEFVCRPQPELGYLHYDFDSPLLGQPNVQLRNKNSIVVANANRSQNATVKCSIHPSWVAEDSDAAMSNEQQLCVVPPYVKLVISPPNPIDEDTNVTLECRLHPFGKAIARKPLEIVNAHTLEKENENIVIRNNSYILVLFQRATKSLYDGQYRCLAEYGPYVPTVLRDEGTVDITQGIPVLRLDIPDWRIEGQKLELKCVLIDALAKFYTFSIYRVVQGADPELLIENDTYVIQSAKVEHSGDYYCTVLRVDDPNDEGVESPKNNTIVYIPHVRFAPPERVIAPGKSGLFECAFKPHDIAADEPLKISRVDGLQLSAKAQVLTNNSYGSLTFSDASAYDATNYSCTGYWSGRTFVAHAKLTLAIPTDFRVLLTCETRTPIYGQRLTFKCTTNPETDEDDTVYTFRFNNRDTLPPGTRVGLKMITIENAQPSVHNGAYSCCAAVEGLSPHCSDAVAISVLAEAPSVTVRPTVAIKAFNQSATFACQYRGVPTPTVQWIALTPDRRPVYDDNTKQMIFTQVTPNNIGNYQCNATNEIGSAAASTWLFGYDAIEANKTYGGSWTIEFGALGTPLTLTCYTGSERTATLWRFNGKEISLSDTNYTINHDASTLTIKSVSEALAGEYTCVSVNTDGRILSGLRLFVGAFNEAIEKQVLDVKGVVGMAYNLSCPASSAVLNRTHVIRWSRIDKRGARTAVTASTPGLRLINNVLVFDNLVNDDVSTYFCDATSALRQEPFELRLTLGNLVPTFSADTLITFPSMARFDVMERFTMEISLLYKEDGLLVYSDSEPHLPDFFFIGLRNGHVELSFSLGEANNNLKLVSATSMSSNTWARISVERYRGVVSMLVQGERVNTSIRSYDYAALELSNPLHFGSHPDGLRRAEYEQGFQGVVSYFSVNGHVLLFGQEYLRKQNVAHYDACAVANPCLARVGSQCLADYAPNGYRCICPENYGGDLCDHVGAVCSAIRCGAMGTCSSTKLPNEQRELNVKCSCPLGVTGEQCHIGVPITSPVFIGQSYIEYAAPAPVPGREANSLMLDVLFLPLERDDAATVLYQASGQSYLALVISDGNIEFLFVESRGSFLSITGSPLTQTETHVRVQITPTKIEMSINGQTPIAIPNTKPSLLSRISGSFVLGFGDNAPDDPLLPREGFEGEFIQVRINEAPLRLSYPIISARNVTDGSRKGDCMPTACNNHGQCRPGGSCECNRLYDNETLCAVKTTESVCDVLPQCECYNGGSCESTGDWFTCFCQEGFTGDRCETLNVAYSAHLKDAYLVLPDDYNAKQRDRETVQFTFKYDKPATKVVNGMLAVYGSPGDTSHYLYFGLIVVRNKVQLHVGYRFGSSSKFEFTSKTARGHTFKDKYTVVVQRVGRSLNITENGEVLYSQLMEFEDNSAPSSFELINERGWYLIGMPELKADKSVNDVGFDAALPSCITDFIVDGSRVDFMPLLGREVETSPGGKLTLNCNLA